MLEAVVKLVRFSSLKGLETQQVQQSTTGRNATQQKAYKSWGRWTSWGQNRKKEIGEAMMTFLYTDSS